MAELSQQFHGDISPNQFQLNKSIVIAVYLITVPIFAYLNRVEILSSEYLLLVLALVMLGASVFLVALPLRDVGVPLFGQQIRFFLEDGFKFAGVATWLAYLWRYTVYRIEPAPISVREERIAEEMFLTRSYGWNACRPYFPFHEEAASKYQHNLEKFIIAICLARELVCVLSNLGEILSNNFLVLFLALAMFGLSISLDALSMISASFS